MDMTNRGRVLLLAFSLVAAPALRGQATESSISKELPLLGGAAALPPARGAPVDPNRPAPIAAADRPVAIVQTAKDIRSLPAGPKKVKLADTLLRDASQGEVGTEALQASADALAQALTESPQPPAKDGTPAAPYMDLARGEHITLLATSLKDAQMDKAVEVVAANDADAAKADFTLKDLNNKKVTLSALKGKIVLINFWSTQCIPCKPEMQDLDLIYSHYAQQGLVVLSINGDNPFATSSYLNSKNYHPQVLSDDGKTAKQFHVDETKPEGLPRTFVFNRDGKLVAESIDMCTQRQFFAMLGLAGLKPN